MVGQGLGGPTESLREKGSLKEVAEAQKDIRSPMCVCQDGIIVSMSERFEAMLGYAPGELGKISLAQLLSQARLTAKGGPDIACMEDNFPVRQGFVRKDGTLVDTFLHIEGCTYRERPAVRLVVRDIDSGAQIPTPAEGKSLTPIPIFTHLQMTVSADGRILTADESCSKVLGYPVHELVDANLEEFISQNDTGLLDMLLRVGHTDSVKGSLAGLRMRRKDGSWRFLVAFGKPISSELPGAATSIVALDITPSLHQYRKHALLSSLLGLIEHGSDLNDIFMTLRSGLAGIMDTTNTCLALVDRASECLSFPYFSDEFGSPPPEERGIQKGLIEYTMNQDTPLLKRHSEILEMVARGEIDCSGALPVSFLGVPLRVGGSRAGALTFRSDFDPDAFTQEDAGFMGCIASILSAYFERRLLKEECEERRERQRLFDEYVVALTISIDTSLRLTDISSSMERFLGYSREELIGQSLETHKVLPEEYEGSMRAFLLRLLAGERVPPQRFRAKVKGGGIKDVEVVGIPIRHEGRIVGVTLFGKECGIDAPGISRQNMALWETSFEEVGDLIFLLEPACIIAAVNRAARDCLGYGEEEIIGKSPEDFMVPESLSTMKENLFSLLSGLEIPPFDVQILAKSGRNRTVEMRGHRFLLDGEPKGIVLFGRDVTRQHATERTLTRSETKYRSLVERLPAVVYTTAYGVGSPWFYVSPQIEGMLGFSPGEWMADPGLWYRQIHPDDREKAILSPITSPHEVEYRMFSKDEKVIWVRDYVTVVQDEKGDPLFLLGVLVDVSERKKAEEEKARHERFFQALIERSLDAVTLIDEEGMILYQSPSIERILGYTPSENIGLNGFALIHPDDVATARDSFARLKSQPGTSVSLNVRMRHKDSSWIHLETTATNLCEDETVGAIVCNYHNISDNVKVKEELHASEEKHRIILETIQDGYYEVDLKGNFIAFNDSLSKIIGYSRDEMVGMNYRTYTDGETARSIFSTFNTVYKTGMPLRSIEWRLVRKDGAARYVDTSVSLMKGRSGTPQGFYGIARDITQRKEMELTLESSESRYRSLVEGAPMVTYLYSFEEPGKPIYVSPQIKTLLGLSAEAWTSLQEIRSKSIHPDDRERVLADYAYSFDNVAPYTMEYRMVTRDGGEIWVRDEGRIIQNGQGKPLYLQGILVDITLEKETENEREAYEKKLSAIHRLTTDLALMSRVEEIGRVTMEICKDVLNFDYSALCLIDEGTDELKTIVTKGHKENERLTLPLKGNGITVWVALNARSLNILDVRGDSRYVEWIPGIRSELCVPLNVRERTIGVLNVESKKVAAFGSPEQRLLETLASEVAIALQNAAYTQERERRIKEIASLNVAFQDIGSCDDSKVRLNLLVEWATNLLQASGGALFLHDPGTSELDLRAHHNFVSGQEIVRIRADAGLPGKVFSLRSPQTVYDCRTAEEYTRCLHARFRSVVGVPIMWKGEVLGVLMAAEESRKRSFNKNEINILESFANFASVIIANSRLAEIIGKENPLPRPK